MSRRSGKRDGQDRLTSTIKYLPMILSAKRFWVLPFLLFVVSTGYAQSGPRLQSAELNEISGLVYSSGSDNVFFVVNDSGDSSRFFAINDSGRLLETYRYEGVSKNWPLGVVDCEEMAAGPGIDSTRRYLYIGDIGDNNGVRPYITIYGFEEPAVSRSREDVHGFSFHLKYPDHPRDAEAFVVDPILKKICIISKREDTIGVYETPVNHQNGDTVTLEKKGSLFFPKKGRLFSWQPVAADMSRDGTQLLIKTYGGVYYWRRNGRETIAEMLKRPPKSLPYKVESQGETIAFNKDGTAYYCISEGEHAIIYRYTLKSADQKE
jgi:hypothetical protein